MRFGFFIQGRSRKKNKNVMAKKRVSYKDFGISKQERDAEQYDLLTLRHYILVLKERDLGKLMCEVCSSENKLEIHHKRYGIDVTYQDLQLLCHKCHLTK